jgi:molybdate transport system ATP-binding protein
MSASGDTNRRLESVLGTRSVQGGGSPGLDVDIRHAVRGFELDVRWSVGDELAVLFGYSGSGKSMTLATIAGLVRPERALISCGGFVLEDTESGERVRTQHRNLGYVTQESTLFPHMSVWRNIEYGLAGPSAEARGERVLDVACALGIERLLDHAPHELSGGQKQRVQLARALALRPRALLLDEPFSALDTPVREEMREVVRGIRDRYPIPVVLVTHDLYEAYTMADRMVVYEHGRVLQQGAPCEIVSAPATPEVERLLTTEGLFRVG